MQRQGVGTVPSGWRRAAALTPPVLSGSRAQGGLPSTARDAPEGCGGQNLQVKTRAWFSAWIRGSLQDHSGRLQEPSPPPTRMSAVNKKAACTHCTPWGFWVLEHSPWGRGVPPSWAPTPGERNGALYGRWQPTGFSHYANQQQCPHSQATISIFRNIRDLA